MPTILICIKNNNYKLNKQNSCNLIIILFFCFLFCFFLIINLFIKVELGHANRSSSTVLTQKTSSVRFVEDVDCGTHHLKGTQPQLIPKKAQNINPIVSLRWIQRNKGNRHVIRVPSFVRLKNKHYRRYKVNGTISNKNGKTTNGKSCNLNCKICNLCKLSVNISKTQIQIVKSRK